MKGGATQRVKISTQQGTAVVKQGGRAGVAKARRGALRQTRVGRGATLWAAGIERRASLGKRDSGGRAPRRKAKAALDTETGWTVESSNGVMAAARSEGMQPEQVKTLLTRGERPRRARQESRSEGCRWVRQSDEPPVMWWDAAKSRRRARASSFVQEDPAGRGTANESEARRL